MNNGKLTIIYYFLKRDFYLFTPYFNLKKLFLKITPIFKKKLFLKLTHYSIQELFLKYTPILKKKKTIFKNLKKILKFMIL